MPYEDLGVRTWREHISLAVEWARERWAELVVMAMLVAAIGVILGLLKSQLTSGPPYIYTLF
jgi:hypothetical protein